MMHMYGRCCYDGPWNRPAQAFTAFFPPRSWGVTCLKPIRAWHDPFGPGLVDDRLHGLDIVQYGWMFSERSVMGFTPRQHKHPHLETKTGPCRILYLGRNRSRLHLIPSKRTSCGLFEVEKEMLLGIMKGRGFVAWGPSSKE